MNGVQGVESRRTPVSPHLRHLKETCKRTIRLKISAQCVCLFLPFPTEATLHPMAAVVILHRNPKADKTINQHCSKMININLIIKLPMQTKRKLLNSQEAAEYLGLSLSYFRKMMMRRVITMYKPSGKLCFFDPDDLDAYLTSIRISSQSEIDSEAERYLANNRKSH